MTDYAKMRRNMVDGQLRTNGLASPALIEQFLTVPREQFLPGPLSKSAYVDDNIPLPDGGFMPDPMVLARLLTAAEIRGGDKVLNIGDDTGYTAAILLGLGAEMTKAPAPDMAYDIILFNGAVAAVPDTLMAQLRPGGKLVAVIRPSRETTGAITVIEYVRPGVYGHDRRSDASVPYVTGYEPRAAFQF